MFTRTLRYSKGSDYKYLQSLPPNKCYCFTRYVCTGVSP